MADELTTVLVRFNESPGVPPSDEAVGLNPLLSVGRVPPGQEAGACGNAATFDSSRALAAGDQTTGATALPRDVTVQALVRWDVSLQASARLVNAGAAGWTGGVSSVQTIAGDGYLEFTADGTTPVSRLMWGLSATDPDIGFASVQYAAYVNETAGASNFQAYESGTSKATLATTNADGDVFRVQRIGTTITYWKNGVRLYTSLTPTSAALRVDLSFFNTGAAGRAPRLFSGGTVQTSGLFAGQLAGATLVPITWQNNTAITVTDVTAPGTLIARGKSNAAAEYMPFALEFVVIDPVAATGQIRWLWQNAAGTVKTQTGSGTFTVPAGYMMITATRRWSSLTSSVIRYYIGDQKLADVATVDGDIASSASGTTTVGGRFIAGVLSNFFAGAIDQLRVLNYEMSAEEISAIWFRISVAQPDGYRQFLSILPPAWPVSKDPTSRVQRDYQSIGAALGYADGQIENFRQNTMPDRAYGPVLRQWESITKEPPLPGDSLDTRRARVIAHMQRRQGVSIPGVEQAIDPLLGVSAGQLQYLAASPTIRDDFSTLQAERWFTPNGGVDVIGGSLRMQLANGASARWDELNPGIGNAVSALLPLQSRYNRARGLPRAASPAILARLSLVSLPINCEAGIVLASWASNSYVFLGVRNAAGVPNVVYQRYKKGVVLDAAPVTVYGNTGTPVALRLVPYTGSLTLGADEIGISVAAQDTAPSWTEASWGGTTINVGTIADLDWAGVYLRTIGSGVAAAAADVRVIGADSQFRDNYSDRAYFWYAYRNPALGGSPDFTGANRVIGRMRHAYTVAAAVPSKSLLCDDPGSLTDVGPMGGL